MKTETKASCYYYNWGGGEEGRPSYPREYGARCEYFDEFFKARSFGKIINPNCKVCPMYNRKKRRPSC